MTEPARVFKALADPTRREILQLLEEGERPAGDIAAHFEMGAPSVSRHLAILSAARLVRSRRDGNRILYAVESQPLLETLNDFLSAVCPTQRLARKRSAKRPKGKGR